MGVDIMEFRVYKRSKLVQWSLAIMKQSLGFIGDLFLLDLHFQSISLRICRLCSIVNKKWGGAYVTTYQGKN